MILGDSKTGVEPALLGDRIADPEQNLSDSLEKLEKGFWNL